MLVILIYQIQIFHEKKSMRISFQRYLLSYVTSVRQKIYVVRQKIYVTSYVNCKILILLFAIQRNFVVANETFFFHSFFFLFSFPFILRF